MNATGVTAGLAESNSKLLLSKWRDSLHVTCGLTACTPGSAPGPTLGNEYGKTLPKTLLLLLLLLCSLGRPTWISLTTHTTTRSGNSPCLGLLLLSCLLSWEKLIIASATFPQATISTDRAMFASHDGMKSPHETTRYDELTRAAQTLWLLRNQTSCCGADSKRPHRCCNLLNYSRRIFALQIGNESVPKIIVNNTTSKLFFFKLQLAFCVLYCLLCLRMSLILYSAYFVFYSCILSLFVSSLVFW